MDDKNTKNLKGFVRSISQTKISDEASVTDMTHKPTRFDQILKFKKNNIVIPG